MIKQKLIALKLFPFAKKFNLNGLKDFIIAFCKK